MIFDDVIEYMKGKLFVHFICKFISRLYLDPNDTEIDTGTTRKLGLVVVRNNTIISIVDDFDYTEIDDPYGED